MGLDVAEIGEIVSARRQFARQVVQNPGQRAIPGPELKAPITSLIRWAPVRQIVPRSARAHDPEHAVQHIAGSRHGRLRPSGCGRGFGSRGSIRFHCASVRSMRRPHGGRMPAVSLKGKPPRQGTAHLRDSF